MEEGLSTFAAERYAAAATAFSASKALSSSAPTVRELLGLSLYYTERWEDALKELRAYRRMTGETTHMALELDCLRALDRPDGVERAWTLFTELGGSRDAEDEARVVYASFLLDSGDVDGAWRVIKPGRLIADAPESALRRWAVAARVAHAAGDDAAVSTFLDAIKEQEEDLPWFADLERDLRG